MKNKIWVLIIILVFIVIGLIYYIIKKNTITFTLIGDDNISVQYGLTYNDLGFVAKDGFGNHLDNYVIVTGNVNTMIPGTYMINYELTYNNDSRIIERIVNVENNNIDIDEIDIKLNGNEKIYLLKGTIYDEAGVTVYNKKDNTVLNINNISITSNIDVDNVGEYDVIYNSVYKGRSVTKTRKVEVFDVLYNITPNELTNKEVEIKLDFSDINNFSRVTLPNGDISNTETVNYKVNNNGEYSFVITLSTGEEFTKIIEIDNIINNYYCKGEITSIGTKILVNPTSSTIIEYKWNVDNEIFNGTNTYNKDKVIKNASVKLTFTDGKTYDVNCTITDKLIYHFKYDEFNNKPFIKANTYTNNDRVRLNSMLKRVVNEAGYGTRAGVVAAARFLVGALDYKIPYQGGNYYNKIGLNIGQNGAWGSSGSGLDCYSFVMWARTQNGLLDDALYSGKKYNTYNEVNRIRVGDYLLTPCSSDCKNPYNINHIGIVVGVDNRYIYVAESKTVDINAVVVTKLDKRNLPKKYSLSLVKHVTYPREGNVTNMWIS